MATSTPISERFVQEAVHAKLNRKHYSRQTFYAGMESYTGLKRADVLLAFMRAPKRPYVVVVECKSRTTIGQLKLKTDQANSLWMGRFMAALLLIGVSCLLGWNWYFNALNTTLLLAAFVGLVVLIGGFLSRMELFFLKSIKAIEQLATYPANESWIAISTDTFVNTADYRRLRRQCRKNRVGLIVVDGRGRLRLKVKPRARHVFNDYLARYGKKREIMKKIDRGAGYGPTPAERGKRWRQSMVGLGGLLLVAAVGALGYEANYGPNFPDPVDEQLDEWTEVVPLDSVVSITRADSMSSRAFFQDELTRHCEELQLFSGRNYLLADMLCKTEGCARTRTAQLRNSGFTEVIYISTDCFKSSLNSGQFLVYNGHFDRRVTTQVAAREMREKLEEAGREIVYGRPLRIRAIPSE